MSTNDKKNETMFPQSKRRELVPVIIAGIVAAAGVFCLWSDLSDESLGRGDGVIRSDVISRAGVIVTPSERPAHLSAPQTAPAFEATHPEDASRRANRMDAEKRFGAPPRSFSSVVDTLVWLRHTVMRSNSTSID
jgi:hypothetical protein